MPISVSLSKLAMRYIIGAQLCSDMLRKEVHHIVGSAPGEISLNLNERHWITCVNASVARINRQPDLWIITDQLFDANKNANTEALARIHGRDCRILLVVCRRHSQAAIKDKLRNLNITYRDIVFVRNFGRAIICQKYCGVRNHLKRYRPSNGIFAIVISMLVASDSKTGSHRIFVSGINPLTVNHFYGSEWGKRGHVQTDQSAILRLQKQDVPLKII